MSTKPILKGQKITLRPIVANDARAMFASLNDKESMYLTGTQQSFTLEQVEAFCARVFEDDGRVDYAVTLPDDLAYLGEVVLNDIDWTNKSAHFRIAMASPKSRDKGFGSEATKLLLEHAFNTLKLHRIALEVFDFNPRAQHVYKKLGFVQEGVLRDVLLWEDKYHNAIQMALLAPDYRAKQALKPFEFIETERLRLRRFRDSDLDAFVAYRSLPEVAILQMWDDYDLERGRKLINGCKVIEPFTAGDSFQFAVALKETDELMGDLYFKMDDAKQAELGYSFAPAFQGQGFAFEAAQGLLNHAFNKLDMHRIYGMTDPRNVASIKLMKHLGMTQEAHFKENLWFKGSWADDVVFAVLKKDWLENQTE